MTASEWSVDGNSACRIVEASTQARPNCLDSVGNGHASIYINSGNMADFLPIFPRTSSDHFEWSGCVKCSQAIFSFHQR